MSGIDKLVKPVENEMNQCKNLFDSFMSHSSNLLLNDVLQRISSRKGKMMRPLLTILVAKLLGAINERTYSAALAFEFLHTASLVHDDIVDESCERRGNPSVNQLFGDKVAVLVGDYLLSHVLLNAAKTESTRLIEIVARVSERLADGELLQLRNIYNQTISEDVYFNIIQGKTAELFAAAAEGGALTVNASEEDLERLRLFGETVGICFQIKDDIFDYIAGDEIGKPTGNDMAEGKLQQVMDTYHLTQEQLKEFAVELDNKGKNPFEQPVDLMAEYKMLHYDDILQEAVKKAVEEALKKDSAANQSSSTPAQQQGGNGGDNQKITTVAGLTALLNDVK